MGVYKRGKSWVVQFFFNSQRFRWVGGETKKEAEEYLSNIKRAIRNNEFEDKFLNRKVDEVLFLSQGIEWYELSYISHHIASEKNRGDMKRHLRYFRGIVGDVPIEKISIRDIERYKMDRLNRVSKSSIDRELGTISGLFSRLAKFEMIVTNPIARKINFYNVKPFRSRVASREELIRIFNTIKDPELKMIALIAVLTGIRLGDIVALRMSNLNFEMNAIQFIQGKTQRQNNVPMPPILIELLLAYIGKFGIVGRLFDTNSPCVTQAWRWLIKSMKIEPVIQFRDLRRSFATLLINDTDADIKLVSEVLGHTDIKITSKVYAILDMRKKTDAVGQLNMEFLRDIF
jgi:integrase